MRLGTLLFIANIFRPLYIPVFSYLTNNKNYCGDFLLKSQITILMSLFKAIHKQEKA